MLDFRKALFAMAVAGLGLVGTASAQVTCTTVTNTTGTTAGIHAEGVTEQLPPVTVSGCTGNPDTTTISVNVTANATFTNAPLTTGSGTDAVGFLNGTTGTAVKGVYTAASNTMTFTFTVTPGSGGTTVNSIVIQNLRINASTLPAGTTYNVTVTGSGTGSLIVSGAGVPTVPLAVSQTSLAKTTFSAYSNVALCNITAANNLNAVGNVNISAGFAGAFTTDGLEYAKETSTGANTLAGNQILSTNTIGTRLAVTFANLSNGVTYYLPVSVSNGSLVLNLVPSATTPCGIATGVCTGAISGTSAASNTNLNSNTNASALTGVYAFTPTSGSFTAYYAVVQTAQSATGSVGVDATNSSASTTTPENGSSSAFNAITLFEIVPSPATALTAATGSPTVQVSIVGNVSPLYAQFAAPATIPTATDMLTSTLLPGGQLTPCNTTLLFPYLVSMLAQNGYDSGIAITNAGISSALPPGSAVTTNATGTCMVTFWGGTSQNVFGSAAGTPITPFTVGPITVSNQQPTVFVLSQVLPSALGGNFVGWAAASCNFSEGHGFAQISNAASGFSEGYLADITSLVQTNGSGYLVTTPLQ